MPPIATAFAAAAPSGIRYPAYRAKITAIAAMMPECMLQNIAQPQRKPAGRPTASVRYTYTPPVRGKADASSAVPGARAGVRAPAASHTARMPGTDGTREVISDG